MDTNVSKELHKRETKNQTTLILIQDIVDKFYSLREFSNNDGEFDLLDIEENIQLNAESETDDNVYRSTSMEIRSRRLSWIGDAQRINVWMTVDVARR